MESSLLNESDTNPNTDEQCTNILPIFAETFKAQLLYTDNPEHPLFHGSWDWHSSCHGHWAFLEATNLIGDK